MVAGGLVYPVALAVPAFSAMRATRTAAQPVVARHRNEQVAAAGRATVLSAASMACATLRVPLVLAGGVLADAAGPLAAVVMVGAARHLGAKATAAVESPAQ